MTQRLSSHARPRAPRGDTPHPRGGFTSAWLEVPFSDVMLAAPAGPAGLLLAPGGGYERRQGLGSSRRRS